MKRSAGLKILLAVFVAAVFALSVSNVADDVELQLDPVCLLHHFYGHDGAILADVLSRCPFVCVECQVILPESTIRFLAMHEKSPPIFS